MRSLDAVHWDSVGDAFQSVPGYAARSAGLGAPEVIDCVRVDSLRR